MILEKEMELVPPILFIFVVKRTPKFKILSVSVSNAEKHRHNVGSTSNYLASGVRKGFWRFSRDFPQPETCLENLTLKTCHLITFPATLPSYNLDR